MFRQAVAHEMLLARETARNRGFDPSDARWRLAIETQGALQGAMLAYEDRKRLLSLATRLGIRPFDANLILAIVQDRARRGEPLEDAAPTIAIVPPAAQTREDRRTDGRPDGWATILVCAVILATAADAVLIAWLIFG